jgi:hypothetical protein
VCEGIAREEEERPKGPPGEVRVDVEPESDAEPVRERPPPPWLADKAVPSDEER